MTGSRRVLAELAREVAGDLVALADLQQRRLLTLAQISWAIQHRVRNRQPDGGLIGLGTSPSSRIRSRRPPIAACLTSGTADSSACV